VSLRAAQDGGHFSDGQNVRGVLLLAPQLIGPRHLKRLWEGDPSRVNAALWDGLENVLAVPDAATSTADADLPGYRLHALKGQLKGHWPVTISGNWRVTRMEYGDAVDWT